ncbi:MAG: peroxiredoxin family protein [Thalassotalea sp.]
MKTDSKKQSMVKSGTRPLWLMLAITLSYFSMTATLSAEQYNGQDWTLKNANDDPVTLSDYQGKPVLLVFWATWCPYCKKLLPGIEALHQKYANNGLKVIAVNIKEDWLPKVYWRNHEYTFDTVLAGDDVADIYGIKGTPALVFIAPDGKVLNINYFSDPKHPTLEKFAQYYLK